MLTEDDPLFANWDQDASAIEDLYDEQAPAAVVADLAIAAEALAAQLDGVSGDDWERRGRRSDGAVDAGDDPAIYSTCETSIICTPSRDTTLPVSRTVVLIFSASSVFIGLS